MRFLWNGMLFGLVLAKNSWGQAGYITLNGSLHQMLYGKKFP